MVFEGDLCLSEERALHVEGVHADDARRDVAEVREGALQVADLASGLQRTPVSGAASIHSVATAPFPG